VAASHTTAPSAALGRIVWMMLGPLLLIVAGFAIVSAADGWTALSDIAYLVILAAMLVGRWLEFRGGQPERADGEPATASDLTRYLLVAPVIGLAGWVLANLVGNGLLGG
jgi:hypothetical protein